MPCVPYVIPLGRGWRGRPLWRTGDAGHAEPPRPIESLQPHRWTLTETAPQPSDHSKWLGASSGVISLAWGFLCEMLYHGMSQRTVDRLLGTLSGSGLVRSEEAPLLPRTGEHVLQIVVQFVSGLVLSSEGSKFILSLSLSLLSLLERYPLEITGPMSVRRESMYAVDIPTILQGMMLHPVISQATDSLETLQGTRREWNLLFYLEQSAHLLRGQG